MLAKNWKKDITTIFEDKGELLNTYPDNHVRDIVWKGIEIDDYLHILYNLGVEYVQLCLCYFEGEEDFETCGIIVRQIEEINQRAGMNIKLEQCEV